MPAIAESMMGERPLLAASAQKSDACLVGKCYNDDGKAPIGGDEETALRYDRPAKR